MKLILGQKKRKPIEDFRFLFYSFKSGSHSPELFLFMNQAHTLTPVAVVVGI